MGTLHVILAVIAILLLFNFMIFFHELGHFIAARWRGLHVDRFQIWFGKPIFKKTINGVQWGLGWIPAGGFVSLPQMAPMEGVEGKVDGAAELPPIKPLDKIIVAFAGPLFSFLLAVMFAVIVWLAGKPTFVFDTTTVGYVMPGSPAAAAGLVPGDRILKIDGQAVDTWMGDMKGVSEIIKMSENPQIKFEIERTEADGKKREMVITSEFEVPKSEWWQRGKLRQTGVAPATDAVVAGWLENSPAAKSGLAKGDRIVQVNGSPVLSTSAVYAVAEKGEKMTLTVERSGKTETIELTPAKPDNIADGKPMLGVLFERPECFREIFTHPTPWQQISQSLNWMKLTLQKVASPGSSVGVEHLSGPVGILTLFYDLFTSPQGILLVMWFAVVLNVNLAVLNLLPFPVVDGGHITFGVFEMLRGRPLNPKFLMIVQNGFAYVLLGFFLFVTFKDVAEKVGGSGEDKVPKFSTPAK